MRAKTVLTDVDPVEVAVPRDRQGTFEPAIVRKRQRRLSGVEDMVLLLSAKGLTTGEISAHLAEVYGAPVDVPGLQQDLVEAVNDAGDQFPSHLASAVDGTEDFLGLAV
ncbi:hypothetical protein GCM10010170_021110 [Dactylosporangium salmoneum]|uniref:Mutator family transposase n=1 Tax=Dactylosporangium salmoneum TaxID=53361 RepID=A0ABN3FWK7_9ACTN